MSRAETLTPELPQGFTSNDFAVAARWVKERTNSATTTESIAATLDAVQSIMRRATRGVLCITDLLPGLEVLHIPANESSAGGKLASLSGEIDQAALIDIGHALRAEFNASNTDMMRLEADEAELIVYSAEVRDVVLAATKIELVESV